MLSPSSSGLAARLTGALFVLLSLALGAGGIYLAALGGSLYYLCLLYTSDAADE